MPLRRILPFILINIVVSATVVLVILFWWDSRETEGNIVTATPPPAALETRAAETLSGPDGAATPGAEAAVEETPESAEPDSDEVVHVVQAGETLGIISQQYDVPVDDIATVNDIVNVNSISVGQQLIIPVGGLPTATPPATATATQIATETPAATETADSADEQVLVEITEVLGVGELTEEAVRISNTGSRPLALEGWQLEDEQGNAYTFIDVTLFGNSDAGAPSILIHTEAGQNGASDLYWGMESAVWESGEVVSLRDADDVLQASYEIP